MNTENYITALRQDLLDLVENRLTPVAMKYGYSDSPLESNIKWRPLVLIVGNYSSGKSTLINDFLETDIQATGQAPTDDSFTVLTCDETALGNGDVRVTEQRDGKYLLTNSAYPFEGLKKHGGQFAAHFCLKKINSPFLKHFAIIDTPGMLDSITERDRGYDYQKVIGDLAHIADLVLVLFDPHKAGTIREAHISLRETLPAHTFEDRVLFVLNRIDECASLNDLLRVYGTLCWNLSQITGRKDIPPIWLTYSHRIPEGNANPVATGDDGYLKHLDNQRDGLKYALQQAPHYHLDHLATFLETHSERLAHLLEALLVYRQARLTATLKFSAVGLMTCLLLGVIVGFILLEGGLLTSPATFGVASGVSAVGLLAAWMTVIRKYFLRRFHSKQLKQIDKLTPLESQYRKETWQAVRKIAADYLKQTAGIFSLGLLKQRFTDIYDISETEAREIREALNEISAAKTDDSFSPASPYLQFIQKKRDDLADA
jgi:EH domain-containing protein 1